MARLIENLKNVRSTTFLWKRKFDQRNKVASYFVGGIVPISMAEAVVKIPKEEQANELVEELKERVAKRHGLLYFGLAEP